MYIYVHINTYCCEIISIIPSFGQEPTGYGLLVVVALKEENKHL